MKKYGLFIFCIAVLAAVFFLWRDGVAGGQAGETARSEIALSVKRAVVPVNGARAAGAGTTGVVPSAAAIASLPNAYAPVSAATPVSRVALGFAGGDGAPQVFGAGGKAVSIDDVPAGRFRDELLALPGAIQRKALDLLGSMQIPFNDVASLHVDVNGMLLYSCPGTEQGSLPAASAADSFPVAAAAAVPISAPPVLHSKAGAANIIYLDFNGFQLSGTAWGVTRSCLPYDSDGDTTTFSDVEQAAITDIWRRVAEDYKPFNVDVTTEEPAAFAGNHVARALITKSVDANGLANPYSTAGGVAYVGVFGQTNYFTFYSPAFIYYNNLGAASNIAEAVAHEVGHNLGLSHDGTTAGVEYYSGHGTGETSWGTIMGTGYGKNITQWSKGEYYRANNLQDDLSVIAARLNYRTDDAGNTTALATPVNFVNGTAQATGIIETNTDVDVFSFQATYPQTRITVSPMRLSEPFGGDLDAMVEILDQTGTVVQQFNPTDSTRVLTSATMTPGNYFLRVSGVGTGAPTTSPPGGYTSYGSLGEYTVTLAVAAALPAQYNPVIGSSANLTVVAGGSEPRTYVWKKNNKVISGAITGTLAIPLVKFSNGGFYSVTVTDGSGLVATTSTFVVPRLVRSQIRAWGENGSGQTSVPAGVTNAVKVSSGSMHSLALRTDGTVLAWGRNTYAECNVPSGLTGVVAIAAGPYHNLALKEDGTVVAWGTNYYASLDTPALSNVIAVACGDYLSVALKSDGTVAAWGDSTDGKTTPPAGLSGVTAISSHGNHVLALKDDGTVVAWGNNSDGQCTVPAGLSNVVAIGTGQYHSIAVKSDGTVVVWGATAATSVPAGLTGVVEGTGGYNNVLALNASGTLQVWGYNAAALAIPDGVLNVVDGDAGGGYFVALRDSSSDVAPAVAIPPSSTLVGIGSSATFSVSATGSPVLLYQWRKNGATITGATGGTYTTPATSLSDNGAIFDVIVSNDVGSQTSSPATLSVKTPPSVTWNYGQRIYSASGQPLTLSAPATGVTPVIYQWRMNNRIISGATSSTLSVSSLTQGNSGYYSVTVTDGTFLTTTCGVFVLPRYLRTQVWAWGVSGNQTVVPDGLNDALSVSAGAAHAIALKGDGTVVAWGDNTYGQTTVPDGLSNVVSVSTGYYHNLALQHDGTVVAWGPNWNNSCTVPASLTNVVAVAAGGYHSLALKSDGTVVGWGETVYNGKPGLVPAGLTNVVAIAASYQHSLALKSDGTVVAWGDNTNGQISVPTGLTNVVAIAAGWWGSVAAKADGSILAWGTTILNGYPTGALGFIDIKAGSMHGLALSSSQKLTTWGANGAISIPAGIGSVISMSAGNQFSLAVTDNTNVGTPIITAHPIGSSLADGQAVSLSVVAAGTSPMTYQWRKGGAAISGAVKADFSIARAATSDSGSYDVVVANWSGNATSNAVTVTVSGGGYETWKTTYMSGLADDKQLPTADCDGCGILNIQRFAFGILPGSSGQIAKMPSGAAIGGAGEKYLTITFRRLVAASPGVTYAVQQSSDLIAWVNVDMASLQVGVAVSNGDGTETVTVRSSVPIGTKLFLRVATSLN